MSASILVSLPMHRAQLSYVFNIHNWAFIDSPVRSHRCLTLTIDNSIADIDVENKLADADLFPSKVNYGHLDVMY